MLFFTRYFPILSFNDTGYFDPTNETNEIWLKEKINLLTSMADDEESYVEMWDNEELKEDESIVTQYEIVNNEEMNSTRAIPQRDNPSGRLSVFPLCYPVHWGNGYGYHYEMPTTMYFPINYGHTNKMPVNELVVTLCHLMSYHWKPSNYPWMYMPYTIDQNKDYLNDSYVIDGYQEVQVKVTKKKYFLGIRVSTKVSYYYSDYFRFLYPWGGSFYRGTKIVNGEKATGWFQQDHVKWDNSNISGYKKYTFINIY